METMVSDDVDKLGILNGRQPVDFGEMKYHDWKTARVSKTLSYGNT